MKTTLLFHYTSLEALRSIIKDESLWASNVRYLNDGAEFTYAVKLFSEIIAATRVRESNTRVRTLLKILDDAARSADENAPRYPLSTVFVASFSAVGDLLSQWRAYCPDQQGVAIGFSQARLARLAAASGLALLKCNYNERQQRLAIGRLIDAFIADAREANTSKAANICLNKYQRRFKELAPTLKHPSFSEEREWRVIASPTSLTFDYQLEFRTGRSMLIPYIRVPLPRSKNHVRIEHVIVGPTPHPQLAAHSVRNLLRFANVNPAQVTNARSPYRSW